ncbi:MAG: hypothetical protein LBS00_01440 [Synergistaceae bacterium]|jgi:hypothetical protein|nr:hypothetical protein [Synergistaceae bacterium]
MDEKKMENGAVSPGGSETNESKITADVEIDMIVPDCLETLRLYESS